MSAQTSPSRINRIDPKLKDQVTLLLVNGASAEAAEAFCAVRGNVSAAAARELVAAARRRITISADYVRDEQIGLALTRLNDLYGKAMVGQDYPTALATQKEISRLLCLYAGGKSAAAATAGDDDTAAVRRQLELIAACLLPLKLAGTNYPIEEHARLAAEVIRQAGLAKL